MKFLCSLAVLMLTLVLAEGVAEGQSELGDILKGVQKMLGSQGELSENKITAGLKEALQIGTGNAVKIVSKTGGYYYNPNIKIPLPEPIRKVEALARAGGFGKQVDEFEMSMNTAAEKAAPEAKSIFWDAIKKMTFSDARKILNGRENEATLYFKDKTHDRLSELFKPMIHQSMSRVGVTEKYQALEHMVAAIPMVGSERFNLDQYVDEKALDGLFYIVAQEEKKIREDPAARVTDLLKEVFAKR
jgi:Protein of unknown function (DUF4197)